MPNEENTNGTDANKLPKQEITQANIEKALREEGQYKTYFEKFTSSSVESFIKDYAFKKYLWWQQGDRYVKEQDNADQHLIDTASSHLEIIQQKKLFDVQCQWRAEKIVIKEVEICFDFMAWQQNIMHCPFIEPLTQQDVELYQSYLATTNIDFNDDFFNFDEWQDYDELHLAYNDASDSPFNFPEWYGFHNLRTGASTLMLLPDIRGKKEAFYEEKDKEERAEEIKKQEDDFYSRFDSRPNIYTFEIDQLENFIETFEDKQTRIYYRANKRENRNKDDEQDLHDIIDYLLDHDRPIAIEGHHDFKEALRLAKNSLKASKLLEFFPYAFEEYQIARSMNFGPSEDVMKQFKWHVNDLKPFYLQRILNGRKVCGEPENLDF